jgi:hypothetical protein
MTEKIINELFASMNKLNQKFAELKKMEDSNDSFSADNLPENSDYLLKAQLNSIIFRWNFRVDKVKRINHLKSVLFSDEVVNNLTNGFLSSRCEEFATDIISEDILRDLWLHAKKTNNTSLAKSIALISKEKGYVDLAREILVDLLVSDFDELVSAEKAIKNIEFQATEEDDENDLGFIKLADDDDHEFPDSIS